MKEKEQIVHYTSEELHGMFARGETFSDMEKADQIDDSLLDDDMPEDFWDNAVVIYPKRKKQVTLRVDADLLDWFRHEVTEHNSKQYQTLIHNVLFAYRAEKERLRKETKQP